MRIFYSKHCIPTLFVVFSFVLNLEAQNTEGASFCAGEEMMQQFLKNPTHQNQQQDIEQQILRYMLSPAALRSRSTSAIVTLPVVVHIIHNGGTENISNAQVLQGIQDLNDAYANRGYYDPTTGVNTDIQFCLAQRDPNGLATNGITRDVSTLTNMTMETDDINLKNINRWQPTCYINIWLIKEINSNSSGSGVAGYAYLPSAHGGTVDGIVEEARWFGSSPANSGVTIHEMGHYLGLFHTFNGDCTNNNCLTDGDHVCDTPPDQSRGAGCNPSANSCTTDSDDPSVNNPFRAIGLGGKGDVADMSDNYMDYSPFSCYSSFTQGQKDRMNFFIQNTRKSLLACKSCETPCPTPISAAFTPRGQTIGVGTSLTFTNTTTNATSYKWRVGTTNYSTQNVTHPFNTIGSFKVVLEASNADARCQSASDSVVIQVVCLAKASITPPVSEVNTNTVVNFTATAQGATTTQWKLNGVVVGSGTTFSNNFTAVGIYKVEFIASNGFCSASDSAFIRVVCPIKASITPLSSEVKPNTVLNFTATVQGATTTQWKVNGVVAGSGTTFSNNFTTVGNYEVEFIASNGICTEVQKAIVVVSNNPINCNSPLFSLNYQGIEGTITLYALREDKNNTFIATGAVVVSSGYSIPYLLKLDATGKVLWAKKVQIDGTGIFYNMKTTTDGGYIAVGEINSTPAIAKFNATGNLEWVNSTSAGSISVFVNIVQTKDGGFAASGHLETNFINFVAKFRADGTTQWTREIGSPTTDWSGGIEEMEDGSILLASNTTSTTNTYLMKLDINTGNFIWQKQYSSGASNPCCDHSFDDISKTPDGNFLVTGNWDADVIIFQKIDNNGKIIWAKKITQAGIGLRGTQSFQTADGGYIISSTDYNNQLSRVIIKLDNNFKVQWQKIVGVGGGVTLKHVVALSNGDYWIGANQVNGFSISKTDALAKSCENFSNSNVIVEDARSQVVDGTFENVGGREMFRLPLQAVTLEVLTSNRCKECKEICGNGIDDDGDGLIDNADVVDCPSCQKCFDNDSVKIVGVDTLCANSNYTFRLKGYKCTKFKTNWLINGNGVDVLSTNDTTLSVRFNRGTTFNLTATIQDSCSIDTIFSKTHVISAPPTLELGPDKTICQTGVFTFKAPRGFKSYLWQDFTTDSVFTAFGVGKYWVRVMDSCGGVQSDTVRIIQLTAPNLNIAPDTLKICEGDSIVVTAPTGFATYRWSPSVGVNDTFKRVITLTPSVSGRYFCAVSTVAGCVSSDSLWVEVKPLLKVSKATSICNGAVYKVGDSTFTKSGTYAVRLKSTTGGCDTLANVILNVINNVTKRIDSLICTNQKIKIGDSTFTKAGNYTVILKNRSGGCDTIVTVNLKTPTTVEQILNRTICQGQVYRVGDSTFVKSGTYKVFINNTLCKDSIITVNLKVTDIAVQTVASNTCPNAQNGRISASIQNGTPSYSYSWSNGATTANLNNLSAGIYLLTITDANNCMDTATITIKATPQYSYNLSVKQPTCFGDANGEIRITSIEKLSISFDSVVFNRSGFLNNLRAGSYPVFVKDTNNCIYSEFINISQPPQLTLRLPSDTLLKLGDSIRIEPFTNGVGRLKYRWQPVRDLSCDTCATVIARPTTGILYTLVLTDSTGCQVRDDIRILINRECNIFIPNVFSPYSTVGNNDVFYPYASDCAKQVAFMEIFDRWGEMVFHKINFPLNDPSNAWDGTFNGKQLEAAVYTYRIEIILADGRLERFFGDVTLIR
jgi:gliding motility-associated-like protein